MAALPAQFSTWSDQGDVIVFSLTKGIWKFQVGTEYTVSKAHIDTVTTGNFFRYTDCTFLCGFMMTVCLVRSYHVFAFILMIAGPVVSGQIEDPKSKVPTYCWIVFVIALIYWLYGLLNRSITITTNAMSFTSIACCTEAGTIIEAIWPNVKPKAVEATDGAMTMPTPAQ